MDFKKAIIIGFVWGEKARKREPGTIIEVTDRCNTIEGIEITPSEVEEAIQIMSDLGLIESTRKCDSIGKPYR